MTTSLKRVLIWEASCLSVEIAGVGTGLWFGLGMQNWGIASAIMSVVCGLSFLARTRHYGGSGGVVSTKLTSAGPAE